MIYFICAQDSKKRIVELDCEEDLSSSFYKYALDITNHKNVMYPYEFYVKVLKKVLPNRVNVIFTTQRKKSVSMIINGIVINSVKEIISTYSNNVDDVYIIATNRKMYDYFANIADYLIVYETNQLGHTMQDVSESINFANYNILKHETFNDHSISYFVVNPDNFLGN